MIVERARLGKLFDHALVFALTFALMAVPSFGQAPTKDAQAAPPGKDAASDTAQSAPQANDSRYVFGPRNLLMLLATVHDKHGKVVGDLKPDDFTLMQDGKTQTLKFFSAASDMPLTVGLLIDTSWNQWEVLDQKRNASRNFLDQMLVKDKDKAFVIHFDREVELLQDLTHKRDKVESALDLLKTGDRESDDSNDPNSRSNDPNSRSDSGRSHSGGTQLYDAIYLASNELLKKQQWRKVLIVLSDGVDRGSKSTLVSAIESAQRSDTIVYSIYFEGQKEQRRGDQNQGMGRQGGGWPGGGWPGGGGGYPGGGGPGGQGRRGGQRPSNEPKVDGKKILERISKETGGRFFEASKKQTAGDAYSEIVEELRAQYSIGYTPDKDVAGDGYHHLKLEAKKKDLAVQTRDGYYGDKD